MRLVKVDIENFRLLESASVALDAGRNITVFVGPNNSGKTSMAEALELLLRGDKPEISDFSITSYAAFSTFEAAALAPDPEPVEDADAEPVHLPPIPRIMLTLHFDYSDTPEDLRIAEMLLMDLDEQSWRIVAQLEFAARDPEQLRRDFRAWRETSEGTLVDFLADRLNAYYGFLLYKRAPAGGDRELLEDRGILAKLIKVDFLPAQRHMEDRESGSQATRLSRLLNSHYEQRHKIEDPASYEELERVVREQSVGLTAKYAAAFDGLTKSLLQFGYPRTPNLTIRAELTASAIFKDNTRVYYAAELDSVDGAAPVTYDLPERYNGLGFKNLIYMVLQLKAFRDDVRNAEDGPPRVHLIVVEEPEAHLHPQMQTVFIDKAEAFLNPEEEDGAQLILTTHSSHIVANCGLSPVRYFRRRGPRAVVKDLLAFQASQTDAAAAQALEFLRRYLTLTRCDLFFCDKAILIEGAVERLLLPKMIALAAADGTGDLTSSYLAVIEVGGAYAHAFKELVEFIEVPTLIVTDLDAVGADKKKCRVALGLSTSNATLRIWLPGSADLQVLIAADAASKTSGRIRVAYQVPDQAHLPCGRSFEEAFVYANADWLVQSRASLVGTGSRLPEGDAGVLTAAAFDLELPKVDFALDLILNSGWVTPKYIADGLRWLAAQPA